MQSMLGISDTKAMTQHTETATPKRYAFAETLYSDKPASKPVQLIREFVLAEDHDRIVAALTSKLTDYEAAFLQVRTALGLHRDSHDDLVVVANALRTQLAQEYARGLVDGHNSMCKTADAELAQAQNEALTKCKQIADDTYNNAAKAGGNDCVRMGGYEDAADHISATIGLLIDALPSTNSAEGEPG